MRGVSADFDLSHAFNKTLFRGRRFDKQLHLPRPQGRVRQRARHDAVALALRADRAARWYCSGAHPRNTTEQPRCPTREERPAAARAGPSSCSGPTRRGSFAPPTQLPSTPAAARGSSVFWLELKINVVWGQLGRGLVLVHQGLQDAAPARVGVYFDEKGVLTLVDGTAKLPPSDTLQRAISVLRRTAPKLQEIVLDVSRLFGADYWRLDVFLSEMAPLHVNGLTYRRE